MSNTVHNYITHSMAARQSTQRTTVFETFACRGGDSSLHLQQQTSLVLWLPECK